MSVTVVVSVVLVPEEIVTDSVETVALSLLNAYASALERTVSVEYCSSPATCPVVVVAVSLPST